MKSISKTYKAIAIFLLILWSIHLFSYLIPLQNYGLIPRTGQGIIGIFTTPFLHGSWGHLINNSISLLIFSLVWATLEGEKIFMKIFGIIIIGGCLTWLFASRSNHIGASGLIFGMMGYLLLSGWFSRQLKYIIVSILLGILYGGMIFGVLPGKAGLSWEGHLFGFVAGVFVSWLYHKNTVDG